MIGLDAQMNVDLEEEESQVDSIFWFGWLSGDALNQDKTSNRKTGFGENAVSSVLIGVFEGPGGPHRWMRLVSSWECSSGAQVRCPR